MEIPRDKEGRGSEKIGNLLHKGLEERVQKKVGRWQNENQVS
jgi:hypothetical protein